MTNDEAPRNYGRATPGGTAATSDERTAWMRSWAEGWLENLKDRPAERYYADLPLEVACDMILELAMKP